MAKTIRIVVRTANNLRRRIRIGNDRGAAHPCKGREVELDLESPGTFEETSWGGREGRRFELRGLMAVLALRENYRT
jgi:hypothetical protein